MTKLTGMLSLALSGALLASAAWGQEALSYPVDPARPFGDIDITPAGATPAEVETFLNGLTGAQLVAVIRSCRVITPEFGGVGADFAENPPAIGDAPPPAAPAPAAPAAPAPGDAVQYPAEATTLCGYVNAVLFGPAPAPAP